MGFFSRFRKNSYISADTEQPITDSVDQCGFCGTTETVTEIHDVDVTTSHGWVGLACDSCIEVNDLNGGFSTYCCGMIYEEGELVCNSCGDPL